MVETSLEVVGADSSVFIVAVTRIVPLLLGVPSALSHTLAVGEIVPEVPSALSPNIHVNKVSALPLEPVPKLEPTRHTSGSCTQRTSSRPVSIVIVTV